MKHNPIELTQTKRYLQYRMHRKRILPILFAAFLTSCGLFENKPAAPGPCSNWAKDSLVVVELLRINGMKDSAIAAWAKSGGLPVQCVDGRVVELSAKYLDSNGNKVGYDTLPPQIGRLTNLEILGSGTDGGGVSRIPPEISNLQKLWALNLSYHQINQIPTEMLQMTNLKELHLGFNILDSFPEFICHMKNLVSFTAPSNNIHSFPLSCKGLESIESLNLDHNSFTTFPEGVLDLPNTAKVFISHNHICSPIPDTTKSKLHVKGWDWVIDWNQDCE